MVGSGGKCHRVVEKCDNMEAAHRGMEVGEVICLWAHMNMAWMPREG